MPKKKPLSTIKSKQSYPSAALQFSHNSISQPALRVIDSLQKAGFSAYLVGGAIRDIVLGLHPKDFDVATNATPEQCRRLFKRSRIIGRRFQIVHVRFGPEIIEVTTFRGAHNASTDSVKKNKRSVASKEGLLLRDNVFGTVDQDALRRDFTCNALYYDPAKEVVLDFCQGVTDIRNKKLRLIGEPNLRFQEDPVRMLRAIRFSAKLGFTMAAQTDAAIKPNAQLLGLINNARLFDESLKLFTSGHSYKIFQMLEQYNLLPTLLNDSEHLLENDFNRSLFKQSLLNTDSRIRQQKSINPAFLWAVFLWPDTLQRSQQLQQTLNIPAMPALQEAATEVLQQQVKKVAITKRFQSVIKEIWEMQLRLAYTQGKKPLKTLQHPRFRAAYDFLLLREQAGENLRECCAFWTSLQKQQPELVNSRPARPDAAAHKPSKRPRKRKPQSR